MMDSVKKAVIKIWAEAFDDSPAYREMYFNHIFRPEDTVTLCDDSGATVSSLLLQRYDIDFHGASLPMGYIAGAATLRKARNRGYMTTLVAKALRAARDRGDMLVSLIPASSRLYSFYDRLGFSTIFYIDRRHYVTGAAFRFSGDFAFKEIDLPLTDDIISAFERLESQRHGAVRHTSDQLEGIMRDNAMDCGKAYCLTDSDNDEIAAIAFTATHAHRILIKDILSNTPNAEKAMLSHISAVNSCTPMTFPTIPSPGRPIQPLGMGRIVNVYDALSQVAQVSRHLKGAIRINDPLLSGNSHTFIINDGKVNIDDTPLKRYDLDTSVTVLTSLLFSPPRIGAIFGMATHRPFLSLMLD